MLLQSDFDFDNNEAQNIVIGKVATLDANAPNGRINYLTASGQQGLYLRKEGVWIHLGQVEALNNGGILVTPVSGVQYLSVRVDGTTIIINGNGDLGIKPNSIGNEQLDNDNIRIGDFAAPNANFSMAGYKITGLGTPTNATDAVNKEYVDQQVASTISATGVFVGDWGGPGYPTVGSGDGGLIQKGDWWRISSVFALGSEQLEVGDALFSKQNSPGTTASNWFTLQNNVGEATTTALGLVRVSESGDLTATAGNNTSRVVRIADLLLRTATATRTGLIQLATQAEVNAGTDALKAVTSATLSAYVNTQLNARGFAVTIGDAVTTQIVATHNFGTRDVIVEVYRNSTPWDKIIVDVVRPSTNSISINFKVAPASNSYRVNILKVA
jgi:hypothetical protein